MEERRKGGTGSSEATSGGGGATLVERVAPAKINLGLHVLRQRADGYHDVETVLLRIPWHDRLTARPADDVGFTCTDPSLPVDERNLCVQAARRLRAAFGVRQGAVLHLEKELPHGAGLGGGSSDAAATLRLLNALWDLEASRDDLCEIAAGLGADVPFFLDDPAAYVTGRGDELQPLRDPATGALYRLPFSLVVVAPDVRVSTAEAYRWIEPHAGERPDLCAVVRSNDLAHWRDALANDFEAPVLARYPAVRTARALLVDAGAGYAALSGSGAAVFGLFEEDGRARGAAEAARHAGHRVWEGRVGQPSSRSSSVSTR